jgi:c(7)-type cytochrome triheme protein
MRFPLTLPRLSFWRVALLGLLTLGLYSTFVRFAHGLGTATNLSDQFPWGLWVGFDILCGVALAAGGFTISAIVYIFHLERFRPIVRPAILTAFLGYVLVIGALMFDLGRPYRIWHPLVMWNPHSVMFEVGWCVTLYTTVLALEFSPMVLERFKMKRALQVLKFVMPPLVILGVLLSTLHQSSLGSFYLIVPNKLYPLWYTPWLPVFFFLTALTLGCAMTIVESYLSSKAFKQKLEMDLLPDIGKVTLVLLVVNLVARYQDLSSRGVLALAFQPTYEGRLFLAEMIIGLVTPALLLAFPAIRKSATGLFSSALLVVMGIIMNRLNVSITGMERSSGVSYVPSLTEVSVTLMIVGVGFALFSLAARYLPVFQHKPLGPAAETEWPDAVPDRRPLFARPSVALGLGALLFASALGLAYDGVRHREMVPNRPVATKALEIRSTNALLSFRMPPDVVFTQSAESPGRVVFRHAAHVDPGAPDCIICHAAGFSIVRSSGKTAGKTAAPGEMHKSCITCHDGSSAFSVESDCQKCHVDDASVNPSGGPADRPAR